MTDNPLNKLLVYDQLKEKDDDDDDQHNDNAQHIRQHANQQNKAHNNNNVIKDVKLIENSSLISFIYIIKDDDKLNVINNDHHLSLIPKSIKILAEKYHGIIIII